MKAMMGWGYLLALSGILYAGNLSVKFHDKASVTGPNILLSDIAEVTSDDAEASLAASQSVIAKAALPGQVRKLRADRIDALNLTVFREQGLKVKVSGSHTVEVRTGFRTLLGVMIQEEARKAILRQMPWSKDKVHLTFSSLPEKITIPDEEYSMSLTPRDDCDWKGNEILDMVVLSGEREISRIPISVRMKVYEVVCVAARKIKRGNSVTDEDIRFEEREITELRDTPFLNGEGLIGRMATRTISEGAVLSDKMIDTPPIVKKGEHVRILSRENNALVALDGIANRDGKLGEKIRVKKLMDLKLIWVYVCGEGLVSLNKEGKGEWYD
ncbi:MAG: flagella basal body P-ring formation protein FlgA [Elusimicrobia bacterium RIFOXYB2_FULL_49_7]|nr:MAG: flagella basal body P-ring formation protein FlgA [Elusimicrobia bacterium RIFOXYB2_FULL_49_7]